MYISVYYKLYLNIISFEGKAYCVDENIEMLKKNGFRTLAELSITSLEELLDIEGMDKETARITIEQAKQHMGNFENA